jgi:hypothetical protein
VKKSLGLFDFLKKKKKVGPASSAATALNIPPMQKAPDLQGNQQAAPAPLPHLPDIEGKISAAPSAQKPLEPLEVPKPAPPTQTLPSLGDVPPPPLFDIPPAPKKDVSFPSEYSELPVFPELPSEEMQEPKSVAVPIEQPQAGKLPDMFEIPEELPAIDAGINTGIEDFDTGGEVFAQSTTPWPTSTPTHEPEESNTPFVSNIQFKQIMHEVDSVHEISKKYSKIDRFNSLKTKEDSYLTQMKRSLESIQRKLMYVDKEMFERLPGA